MSSTERPEQVPIADNSNDFSLSKFFHEVYDKGVVSAVEDHPKEAVTTAVSTVGALAAGAAAIYLSHGRLLTGLFRSATTEASAGLNTAAEHLIGKTLPIGSAVPDITEIDFQLARETLRPDLRPSAWANTIWRGTAAPALIISKETASLLGKRAGGTGLGEVPEL
jgi:hypothetical protein